MKLNWRHKAGLFLTLGAVGCGLFLECSAKQAAGIALLGIAFAWLIGSVSPRTLVVTLAILISGVGLYVAATPIWSDRNSVNDSAAEYDLAMADLQSAVKGSVVQDLHGALDSFDLSSFQPINRINPAISLLIPVSDELKESINASKSMRTITIHPSVQNWILAEKKPATAFDEYANFTGAMSDAEIMKAFQTDFLLPKPTFSFGSSVRAHPWNVIGGLALFISGLSVLGWLFRRTRVETRSRYAVP